MRRYEKRYTKDDVQVELDIRNGNFDILEFNGCRNKSQIRCRKCKSVLLWKENGILTNKKEVVLCPIILLLIRILDILN